MRSTSFRAAALAALVAASLVTAASPVAAAVDPIGEWKLAGNYRNLAGTSLTLDGVNDPSFVNGDVNGKSRKVLSWNAADDEQGLTLSGIRAKARKTYTIEVTVAAQWSSYFWTRIIAFGPPDQSEGIYSSGGIIRIYPQKADESGFVMEEDGTFYRITVTRNDETKRMKLFVDGELRLTYVDSTDLYLLRDGEASFFLDDDGDTGIGEAAGVRFWSEVVLPD